MKKIIFISLFIMAFALPSYSQWGSNQNAYDAGRRYAEQLQAQQHDPSDCPGKVTCRTCNGSGTVTFYNMFGAITSKCATCNGTGKQLCPNPACQGARAAKNIQKSGAYAPAPSGSSYSSPSSGSSSGSRRQCSGCGGSGKCSACKYSDRPGKQKHYNSYGPDYYTDCPVCHGSAQCKVCFGKGVI